MLMCSFIKEIEMDVVPSHCTCLKRFCSMENEKKWKKNWLSHAKQNRRRAMSESQIGITGKGVYIN